MTKKVRQQGEEELVWEGEGFDLQPSFTCRDQTDMATAGFTDFSWSQLEPEAEVDGASEQIELDDESFLQHYYSMLGGKLDSPSSTRKLGHNAYERDRRKKTNDLYSSLRSLLPESKQNVCNSLIFLS